MSLVTQLKGYTHREGFRYWESPPPTHRSS